jgi:hypothetical protein
MTGKIDDPFEASLEGWPEEHDDAARAAALSVAGVFSEVIGVFDVVRERFRVNSRLARFNYLFEGARLKFCSLESRVGQMRSEIDEIKRNLASKEFREAAETAAEEAVRAVSAEKIDQFSSILVGSVDPSIVEDSAADASALIRDVAQLSAMDLKILGRLKSVYGDLFPPYPSLSYMDPNPFTEKIQDFKDAITASGLTIEEFQSVCDRLRGFGLAAEVLRNVSRMAPSDYCYRPTRRGLKLLKLLGSNSDSV